MQDRDGGTILVEMGEWGAHRSATPASRKASRVQISLPPPMVAILLDGGMPGKHVDLVRFQTLPPNSRTGEDQTR